MSLRNKAAKELLWESRGRVSSLVNISKLNSSFYERILFTGIRSYYTSYY